MQLHVSEEGAGQNRSSRAAGLTHGRALAAPIMEMGLTCVEKKGGFTRATKHNAPASIQNGYRGPGWLERAKLSREANQSRPIVT
jgi:hypothetical protein